MPTEKPDPELIKDILAKIRRGLVEGVRKEVERRRKLGLPIHVERDGVIVDISQEETSDSG